MKRTLVACMVFAAALFTAPTESTAHAKVRIYLGVPHYAYRVGPDYVYRSGWGWYRPARARISCQRARNIVKNRGYRNVDRVECNGATYTFRGTRGGKRYVIYVNSRSGGVWR